MNLKFNVPDFPAFHSSLNTVDYGRYTSYVRQFQSYASNVVGIQARLAEKAVEKGYLREELVELRTAIADIVQTSNSCVEKTSVMVENEFSVAKASIVSEVEKLKRVTDELGSVGTVPADGSAVNVASGTNVVHGESWARNVKNREIRKARKLARQAQGFDWRKRSAVGDRGFQGQSSCSPPLSEHAPRFVSEKSEAQRTLEEKWAVENRLAKMKAERQLEVYASTDVQDEVKKYRTGVRKATERNMVDIETTHRKLKATGNVPGSVETIVSGDDSISPSSSISEAEIRKVHKLNLDLTKEVSDLKAQNEELLSHVKAIGVEAAALPFYVKKVHTVKEGCHTIPVIADQLKELGIEWSIPGNAQPKIIDGKKKIEVLIDVMRARTEDGDYDEQSNTPWE